MLDFTLIIKIGVIGIVTIILDKVLKSGGRDDYATMVNFAGIIIILMMITTLVIKLFSSIQTLVNF
ncbi:MULTISPECIES: stage III sporulation protein AC [Clostridium]|uniref:Stage III sporulation protein AC n=1 Tax=Clostridium senegalense TaxID=1465809 RepID=A0A6M0H0C3_9CLOT|nr:MULTISPECIES: stage III sporulation protein AC [Clostridium]MBU5225309.1 stage III sporulation protein AC [Clostridium senegalense]NEU03574.1 stage III sporulation protein AC [Clostridium senegalense]